MDNEYKNQQEWYEAKAREIKGVRQKEIGNKIIVVILVCILSIAMIRFIVNPQAPDYTFTNFLQDIVELGNNQINIVQLGSFNIDGSGILIDILNYILSLINIAVWWSQSIINIVIVLLKILQICLGI